MPRISYLKACKCKCCVSLIPSKYPALHKDIFPDSDFAFISKWNLRGKNCVVCWCWADPPFDFHLKVFQCCKYLAYWPFSGIVQFTTGHSFYIPTQFCRTAIFSEGYPKYLALCLTSLVSEWVSAYLFFSNVARRFTLLYGTDRLVQISQLNCWQNSTPYWCKTSLCTNILYGPSLFDLSHTYFM